MRLKTHPPSISLLSMHESLALAKNDEGKIGLTDGNQAILSGPPIHTHSLTVIVISPMLPVPRFCQVEWLGGGIRRCEDNKHISVLASLLWWPWWVVRHDILETCQRERVAGCCRAVRDEKSCCDPMAKLGPFGTITRRSIWVGDGDCVCHIGESIAGLG